MAVAFVTGCSGDGAPRVREAVVARTTVTETVDAPGTVTARAVAGVTSPAAGTVASVLVTDGAAVRRGAVLMRLSSPTAQSTLQSALAAQAAGGSAAGRALAEASLSSARATVDALTVRAPIDGLVTLGASSGGSAAAEGALAGLPDALAQGAASLLGGDGAGPTVTTHDLSVGSPVGVGTPLLTVTDVSALGLVAEVDETDVLLVRKGVRATVEIDALPDASFEATVTAVDLAPTATARGGVAYRVRLSLGIGRAAEGERPPQRPRPGMSAVVDLIVRTARDVVSVPSSAVVRDDGRDVVFVLDGDRVRRRPVRVGAVGDDAVEVLAGVRLGERVVARDADRLRDGQSVRR